MKRIASLSYFILLLFFLSIIPVISACQEENWRVTINVDGTKRALLTRADTIRGVLREADISLGSMDKVEPDLYIKTQPGMNIFVIRVREEISTVQLTIPFKRKVLPNEAMSAGETRLVQLGENGIDEITYQIVYEDNVEVRRTELSRMARKLPIDEILAVGAQTTLPAASFEGTIAYLSGNNAWVMKEQVVNRRPLTTSGDLDGRAFSLSPNGSYLLYTRPENQVKRPAMNQLWLQNTSIIDEAPVALPITNILWAAWSPDGSQIAYSTADRTPGPPGWRARNDLWLTPSPPRAISPTLIIPPSAIGVYSWWGMNMAWDLNGKYISYARADQIGVIDLAQRRMKPLLNFTPYRTNSEWIWLPFISWSPDSDFLIATIHGEDADDKQPDESVIFDLWSLSAEGNIAIKIKSNVGMWSNPAWGLDRIVYGAANNPQQSVDSRYALFLMDIDGSNAYQIFPAADEIGVEFPQLSWLNSDNELIYVYNGNLYLMDIKKSKASQLTAAGDISRPKWAASHLPLISPSPPISPTVTKTTTNSLSDTTAMISFS